MNDLISRQAAIALADSTDCVELSIEDVKKVTDKVVNGLKRLPPAQKRGKWMHDDFGWHCSECWVRYPDEITDELNYCPNCGARMKAENETD